MSRDVSSQIVRDPRHRAKDITKAWAEVLRRGGRLPKRLPAMLIDLSRKGIQLRVAMLLERGERITVRLLHLPLEEEYALDATVQWMRLADGNTYAVGCQFDDEIDFEILGELFLDGLLDTELAT